MPLHSHKRWRLTSLKVSVKPRNGCPESIGTGVRKPPESANVPFSVGFGDKAYEIDVDHIVIGPYGVLVLETKFSSSPVDLGSSQIEKRVSEAMVQVEDNAGRWRQSRVAVFDQRAWLFWASVHTHVYTARRVVVGIIAAGAPARMDWR